MNVLESVDLSLTFDGDDYRDQLARHQVELREQALELYRRRRSLVVVYEGWDAAGKGSNIRRVTEQLDPRGFEVHPIGAPAGDDANHHYLWRFWRRLRSPDDRQILIFDRSWYGRVLVERVDGFATETEWRRAYREINDFERQMVEHGMVVVKFWIHVDRAEQLRRFEARRETPHKSWKLTPDDWRNRQNWESYEAAVDEMVRRTSTPHARWHLIAGNDKRHARVTSLRTLVEAVGSAL